MKKTCPGCGVKLQSQNPKALGYINEEILNKKKDDFYCQRCFKLKHYNQEINYHENITYFHQALDEVKISDSLIVLVVSVNDLEASIIPNLETIIANKKVILFVNKYDLLTKVTKKENLRQGIKAFFSNYKFKSIIIGSAFTRKDIFDLIEAIQHFYNNKNIYFIGATNVGKSSIINELMHILQNKDKVITTSNTLNTTLGNIYIPFSKNSYIIDTPGLRIENSYISLLTKKTYDLISPKKPIKARIFQLLPLQTLFIDALLRVDFLSGDATSFVCYFANQVLIHRSKLINADSFYHNHLDNLLLIPPKEERSLLGKIKQYDYDIKKNEKIDISIFGLGFMSIKGEAKIRVHLYENVGINFRKAII